MHPPLPQTDQLLAALKLVPSSVSHQRMLHLKEEEQGVEPAPTRPQANPGLQARLLRWFCESLPVPLRLAPAGFAALLKRMRN